MRSKALTLKTRTESITCISAIANIWPEYAKMIKIFKAIIKSESICPDKPDFSFKMTMEVAEKSFLILKRNNFDLEATIKSPVGYGLEFWKPKLLAPLLGNHPLWPLMNSILQKGSQWPTEPISEEEQTGDVEEALEFGNHKGAKSQPDLLVKLVSNDVIHNNAIALPLNKVIRIPNICMAPLNIQAQWTINVLG